MKEGPSCFPVLAIYRSQQREKQMPTAIFNDAARLPFIDLKKPGRPSLMPPLRPLLSEAEMSVIAGNPVVLVKGNRLPHHTLNTSHRLSADEAEERNTAILNHLHRRGIHLPHSLEFETAGDCVGAWCSRLELPARPSQLLNQLAVPETSALSGLPASLMMPPSAKKGWTLMVLPALNRQVHVAWMDHIMPDEPSIERTPASADIDLLLQLHELGHTRQERPDHASSRNVSHANEADADNFAYFSYAALGGSAGIAQAARAGWCLANFLNFKHMKNTHLTGIEVCLHDAKHLFGTPDTLRLEYSRIMRKIARGIQYKQPRATGATRLLELKNCWQQNTNLNDRQLLIAGITLEAAQIYMPKLMNS